MEPLGENSALDKAKLVESRKPADRKAVKKAYEKAILHRCRVTGENTGLSGDSDNETNPPWPFEERGDKIKSKEKASDSNSDS